MAGGEGPAAPDQWEGRGQRRPLRGRRAAQERRRTMEAIDLGRREQRERRTT